MSHELSTKIRLALEQLAVIREQFQPLVLMVPERQVGVIETAAACAMLHSFYTEIREDGSAYWPRIGRGTAFLGFMAQRAPYPSLAADNEKAGRGYGRIGGSLEGVSGISSFVPRGVDCSYAMGQDCSFDCEGRQHL